MGFEVSSLGVEVEGLPALGVRQSRDHVACERDVEGGPISYDARPSPSFQPEKGDIFKDFCLKVKALTIFYVPYERDASQVKRHLSPLRERRLFKDSSRSPKLSPS